MKRLGFWTIVLLLALAACSGQMPGHAGHDGVAIREMSIERLPDLNIPRNGHVLVDLDGELTVIGGHTTGFVLTETAEYYKNGSWHLLETLYPHDFGSWVKLPSGEVLTAGGCEQSFGRGQSWGVESYDPSTHTFAPLSILDRRRTRFNMARLSDGTLLVSGNWYQADAIAIWSAEAGGLSVKDVSHGRSIPFVLPVSADNAYVFGCYDHYGSVLDPIIVDQLKGDAFRVPLFDQWQPVASDCSDMSRYFIGDERIDGYAWLFHVRNKADGHSGIMKLVGGEFSLLDTDGPIPMTGLDGEPITWGGLLTDTAAEASWLVSFNESPAQRMYFCKMEYGKALRGGKAPLTLYYARMSEPGVFSSVTLLSGRIAVVGGIDSDNNHPIACAFILNPEPSSGWFLPCACLRPPRPLFPGGSVTPGKRKKRQAQSRRKPFRQLAPTTAWYG